MKDERESKVIEDIVDFNKTKVYVNKKEGIVAVDWINSNGQKITRTTSHCSKDDEFDLSIGFALCFAKAAVVVEDQRYHDFIRSYENRRRKLLIDVSKPKVKKKKSTKKAHEE